VEERQFIKHESPDYWESLTEAEIEALAKKHLGNKQDFEMGKIKLPKTKERKSSR
jgi:hypothetical protein